MQRDELVRLLAVLVRDRRITQEQAAALLAEYDAGNLDPAALPLPAASAEGITTGDVVAAIVFIAAAGLLSTRQVAQLVVLARQPTQADTPPALRQFIRKRLRAHFRLDYERTVERLAKQAERTGNVQRWHDAMRAQVRAYMVRQLTAGLGRPPTAAELAQLDTEHTRQMAFLQRFGGEMAVTRIMGQPFSAAYIGSRSEQYGGAGWAQWFRGNEIAAARGDGWIVDYVDRDDPRVCSPCRGAAAGSPYLPGEGAYPGSVCVAHGKCRCERVPRYAPDVWRRLTGRAA